MDNSYGVFDTTVLKAGSTPSPHHSPSIDALLIKPTSNANMQLSHAGLYERMKREDMASDISGMFSQAAAAAHLYEKAQMADRALRLSAYAGLDFQGLRSMSLLPSCAPAFDVADFIAASNSFNFLSSLSSAAEPAMDSTQLSTSMNGMGVYVQGLTKQERKPSLDSMRISAFMAQDQAVREPHQISKNSKIRGYFTRKSDVPNDFKAMVQSHAHNSNYLSPNIATTPPGADSPKSPNSPSKQDSVLSAEDVDADWSKTQSSSKRRKTQQKRIVCVPVGDAKQLKGETPPSDLWAWRKYGQKPIKGSPYPRGYYRCSSSKGCSARKQVERSCSDPTMLIVTYTSEHNHTWPLDKTSAAASLQMMQKTASESKENHDEDPAGQEAATSSSCCDVANESFFSSIINSASTTGEQVVSSSLQEEESFSLKRDVDFCFLTRTSTVEEDDVFDDLEELPEMSSIFSKGYLDQDFKHKDEGWHSV